MKAYLASPYRSHVCWETVGRQAPIQDAMRAMLRLSHKLRPVFSALDVRGSVEPCIWSPLIEGDIVRAKIQHFESELWPEPDALEWCRWNMQYMGFTHLVWAQTIPRKPGYGRNGVDMETDLARELGLTIVSDVDIAMG